MPDTKSAIVIGNGIAGLLLANSLARKNMTVTVLYRPDVVWANSPIILPEIAISFMEKMSATSIQELRKRGAVYFHHRQMMEMIFRKKVPSDNSQGFLFLSRNLLTEFLNEESLKSGVQFREERVLGLEMDHQTVTGVHTPSGIYKSDFIFDCTGGFAARADWFSKCRLPAEKISISGPDEHHYIRFYESDADPSLILRSAEHFRGGIYPMENKKLAVSYFVHADHVPAIKDAEQLVKNYLSELGGDKLIANARPLGEWKTTPKIRNVISDFYTSPAFSKLRGFYPVGDGVMKSNPIYGRGISLTIKQMSPLFAALDAHARPDQELVFQKIHEGFELAKEKWGEVSNTFTRRLAVWARRYYTYLIEKDPVAYNHMLCFFQMKISAPELGLKLMMSPLSVKIMLGVSLTALLILSGGAFFLR